MQDFDSCANKRVGSSPTTAAFGVFVGSNPTTPVMGKDAISRRAT